MLFGPQDRAVQSACGLLGGATSSPSTWTLVPAALRPSFGPLKRIVLAIDDFLEAQQYGSACTHRAGSNVVTNTKQPVRRRLRAGADISPCARGIAALHVVTGSNHLASDRVTNDAANGRAFFEPLCSCGGAVPSTSWPVGQASSSAPGLQAAGFLQQASAAAGLGSRPAACCLVIGHLIVRFLHNCFSTPGQHGTIRGGPL